jgi:hypothetical protein
VEVAADRADHHLPGVQPDPDVDRDATRPLDFGSILLHRALHGQRRIAGAHGMVFMADRGAKQRHDAVAHDLIHRPFIAVHRVHHPLQHGVEKLARLLGVAIG